MKNIKRGYSIIEILVVVGVFAILAVLATQSMNLSLKSSKKGDSMVLVKQELENTAGNIERQLQTASSVIVGGVICTTTHATSSVGFRNSMGYRGDYACIDSQPFNLFGTNDTRIASSSGEVVNYRYRLTSNNIGITNCQFSCYTQDLKTFIDFSVTANVRGVTGAEGSTVSTSRKILIREASRK